MREIKKLPVAQGDVLIIPRGRMKLPAGLEEVQPEGGRVVVAHSETGHHHAIDMTPSGAAVPPVSLFRVPGDPMTMYLRVDAPHADVVHHRPWDTHETLRLLSQGEGTVFEIKRQREPAPEGWRRLED